MLCFDFIMEMAYLFILFLLHMHLKRLLLPFGSSKRLYAFFFFFSAVIFMVWAYVPENWLHSVGIFYYPSRYWALAVPAYLIVTVTLAIGFYIGLNFMATPPPTSFSTMFDEFTREPLISIPSTDGDEQPIEPISDIGINQINKIMFKDLK